LFQQAPHEDVISAIDELGRELIALMESIPLSKHDYAYAPGKWTLKEVLQHIIDTERVFCYRALCIARKEAQSLPGFDENSYAANSKASNRDWNDLIEEFKVVRAGSKFLFDSFDSEQMENSGVANKNPLYVSGIGYIIAGHAQHHLHIIRERYL
jgi:hypothetical protein